MFAPDELIAALSDGGVEYVLIGGLAVGAHGFPRATKDVDIVPALQRLLSCSTAETVATFRPKKDGSFKITVAAPAGGAAALYRLRTKVRTTRRSPRLSSTFTLPRAVDFR